MYLRKVILSLFLFQCILIFSLETKKLDLSKYKINHWDIYSGLCSDSITSIYQDSKGYIWIGTYDGFMRYNGREFVIFDETNTPGVIGHSGNVFLETLNEFWIGSGQGLIKYSKGQFKSFTKSDGLLSNSITALSQDNSEKLWVGTNQGLQIYSEGEFVIPGYNKKNPFTGRAIGFVLYHENLGLIVSCDDGGLYINCESDPQLINGSGNIRVSGATLMGEGFPLVGTRSGELFKVTVDGLVTSNNLPTLDSSVRDLYSNDGTLFIITSKGLYRITSEEPINVLSTDSDYGLLQSVPKAVLYDNEGNMWLGTRSGGLYALTPSLFVNYDENSGLTGNAVNSVAEYPDGIYWFATDKGVFCKDKQGFINSDLTKLLMNTRVKHLNATKEILYVSTISSLGVVTWDGESIGTINKEDGLPSTVVKKTLLDSRENLWISTSGGVACLSKDNNLKIFSKSNGFLSDEIYDVYEDSVGRIWVCTVDDGLLRIEKNGSYQRFSEREGLIGDMVFSVREDLEGDFWVSTASGCFFIRADDSIFPLGYDQGLPYLYVYNSQPIKDHIYFTSVKGFSIASLDEVKSVAIGKQKKFNSRLYNWNDGLSGSPNALSWLYLDSKESLWIPTHRGVSSYSIDSRDSTKGNKPPLYIESVNTEKNFFQDPDNIYIPEPVDYLTLKYSIPILNVKGDLSFRYWLEGYNKEWSNPSGDNEAVYTGLPSGEYTFHLKAVDSNNTTVGYQELIIKIGNKKSFYILIVTGIIILILTFLIFILKGKLRFDSGKMSNEKWKSFQIEFGISPRELEVVKLVVAGNRDKEIAVELDCAVSTVSNTLSRVYKKTLTSGRYDLIRFISAPKGSNSTE